MPFVRTGLLAIADAEKQDKAINAFTTLREKGLKVSQHMLDHEKKKKRRTPQCGGNDGENRKELT